MGGSLEYRINELSFNLPDFGWDDRSDYRLRVQASDGTIITLEISRNHAIARDALAARVQSYLETQNRHLRGFELVAHENFQSTEVHGVLTSFRTLTPEGAVYHEVAYVPLVDVLLVFSVRASVVHAGACRELIREAIESLELRRPEDW